MINITPHDAVQLTTLTFTATPAAGATSGTLTANFLYVTGTFTGTFSNGETRTVTLTAGATTCTWSGGLNTAVSTTLIVAGAHDGAQTSTTALVANSARTGLQLQNQGTNPLFVFFGSGASTSVYNFILKACTGAADGTGGSFSMMDGNIYRGIITIAGTSPSYSIIEL
jgi:hypothetical protein